MNIVDVWLAFTTVDDHGRTGKFLGAFRSELFAEVAAKDKGWYGGPGTIRRRKAIVTEAGLIYVLEGEGEPLTFADDETERELREKTLANLGQAERKALGL